MKFQFYNTPWIHIETNNWQYLPFKQIFEFQKEKSPSSSPTVLSLTLNGVVVRDISTNEGQLAADYSDSAYVSMGDFILNPMDLRSGSVAISNFEGVTSNAYYIFRVRENFRTKINPKFYEYYLRANYKNDAFYSHGSGIGRPEGSGGRWTLGRDVLQGFPVPLPSLVEQNKIVEKIEKVINSIDEILSLKSIQTNLFNEWVDSERTRLIAGLDDKDKIETDIPWIRSVKRHWMYVPLRSAMSWRKGVDSARLNAEYCSRNEGSFPVYSGQTENEGIFGSIDSYDFDFPGGCLLISTVGAQAGRLRFIQGKFSLSQNCAILVRKNESIEYSYIFYLWNSLWGVMKSEIPTDMQPSVRFSDLAQQRIFLPPINEQIMIVNKIKENESYLLDRLQSNEQAQQKLRELKDSLLLSTVAETFTAQIKWGAA